MPRVSTSLSIRRVETPSRSRSPWSGLVLLVGGALAASRGSQVELGYFSPLVARWDRRYPRGADRRHHLRVDAQVEEVWRRFLAGASLEVARRGAGVGRSQRDLSANTISSYRDTWRMLLKYLTATRGVPADVLDFDAVTAAHVTGFLDYLEDERGNRGRTRNARLTAIRSVLGRALPDHPEHAATITQVLAIPPKRSTRTVIEFLTPDEVAALLAAPDTNTWTGRRDHALLTMTVQTGLRISEICSLPR